MQLRQRLIDALGADALTHAELATRLGEPVSTIRRLIQDDSGFTDVAERIAYLPALLDGVTWVVPIDADDAASDLVAGGFVRTRPYLTALSWWLMDGAAAVDGDGSSLGPIETDALWLDGVDSDVLVGEPGWLDAVAGGWAAVTVRDEQVVITPTDGPPEATAEQTAAVARGFEAALEERAQWAKLGEEFPFELASSGSVLHAALVADRDAFRAHPVPPIDTLVPAAGLELRDDFVVAPGFDWAAFRTWQQRNLLRIGYGIDDRQIELVQMLVGACELHAEEGDVAFGEPTEWAGAGLLLAAALDDPDVTAAFTGETTQRAVGLDQLVAFAEALDRHARAGGSDRNEGVTAVLVRAHTLLGDEQRAAALLDANVDGSTRHGHLLHLAAELAADRGRAAEARQLVLRTGVTPYDPDDDRARSPWDAGPTDAQLLLAEVEPYARARARRDVGRNSPCPCGSGKKYKACHLGKEEAPLVDRAPWLYQKCTRYVRTRVPASLDDVADELTHGSDHHPDELADSPIVADLVLHEHEVDQQFLEDRGPFLPDDEQLLAAQWALVDRSVFDVEDVRRRPDGGELHLRDLATGDVVVVSQVHLGDQIRPGVVLLGRPLPVGDTFRAFSGFWPLDRTQVNAAIDAIAAADDEALCRVMAAGLRPPTMSNTDGHPLEFHRIRWGLDVDPAAAGAVLTEAGLEGPDPGDDADNHRWTLVRDSANQRDTVIATIEVRPSSEHDAELVIEVNSEERAEELDALMDEWFPDAQLIEDEILDWDEVTPPGEMPSVDDPAVRAAVEQQIARYEEQWLDDHIPALQGRTPREAVQDPVGREEVLQLLAGFPEPPPGTPGMSPTRLRAALGL